MVIVFDTLQDLIVFVIAILAISIGVSAIICAIRYFIKSPFKYPYFEKTFNVSNKRRVDVENYIDKFLCNARNREDIVAHADRIQAWKEAQEKYLSRCIFKKHRRHQYNTAIDDSHAYRFKTTRTQTRYRQKNYVKTSYKVSVPDKELAVSFNYLTRRNKELANINYEATLKDYHAKNQRRLMTPTLRREIMERDNYTCQICGKHMSDEVGLQIDHILPVARGGKTVASNLQVLCSKCNGSKGSKV